MNKTFKSALVLMGFAALGISMAVKVYAESQRQTAQSATASTILIDPKADQSSWTGYSIDAVSDKLAVANGGGAQVKVWSRNPYLGKMKVTTALTTALTTSNIIVETTSGINVNDVVYCVPAGVSYNGQARGFVATITVVPAGGTNVYASAVLTTNLAAGSYVYPMKINYQTFVGSNSVNRTGSPLFETAGESPLRIILDSVATNDLSITVK